MTPSLISIFTFLLSIGTASGIFIHDTKLDKATATFLTAPTVQYDLSGKPVITNDTHPHAERTSFSQAMRSYQTSTPGIQPRSEDRRHLLQKYAPKGHHAFDNYNLPLV
ncbi:MAG TPA: hypothetical protein VFH06_01050 [Candidatus Saccharimonadales bacterium]|nr:hypothetical protein [Candidatus Saccharimonadales bacterium]